MYPDSSKDKEMLDSTDTVNSGVDTLTEEATKRAVRIVSNVEKFVQPRLDQIKKYRELYAGHVKPKYRQPFNVVLPVFSGMMDTLMAGFNDDLSTQLDPQEPADYIPVCKIEALWNQELNSTAPNARFPYKTRTDRSNALFSGRGFMMNYAVSKPEYRNCFEIFELEDAIFQPTGGGIWHDHLYRGRKNVIRSASSLETGDYDQKLVKRLLERAAQTDYAPFDAEDERTGLSKFKAMGLDVKSNDYVGEQLFKLVEMILVIRGTPYHLVFSPWYEAPLRFDKLKNVFSAGIDPWVSWATHEDNKNFTSKSFADDCYGVADAVHTLFNQELTNREKRNLNARAYDPLMFKDVAKLDAAQYRPDALVPFDSGGGVRKISDGLYTFETPQLQGTIDLINWMNTETGKDIGVTDVSQGQSTNVSKKVGVVLAEQQNVSKRLLLRSSPYTEAMGEIVKIFIQGAKDHLPASKALRRIGARGEDWEAVIRRTDLDLYADIDVKITTSSIEMRNSQLKKDARMKVLDEISADPNQAAHINRQWLVQEKLRSGGEFDDTEIQIAMDTKNYGNEIEVARAHEAIQAVQNNEKPQTFYGATTLFMQIIHDFAINNRNSLGDPKYQTLIDYEMAHAQIAQENMLRKADDQASAMNRAAPPANDPNAAPPAPASGAPAPAPSPIIS